MMQSLDLNFAQPCRPFNRKVMVTITLIMLLFTAYLLYLAQLQEISIRRLSGATTRTPNAVVSDKVDSALEQKMTFAHQTQHALNLPWHAMFTALEQAQSMHPSVYVLMLQPDFVKSEILFTGQTSKFDELIAFQASLSQQPHLDNVVLLNQHSELLDSSQSYIRFTLSMGWRP